MKSADDCLQTKLDEMDAIAIGEVERLARKILSEHTNLKEFVMGMGGYFFVYNNGEHLTPISEKMNSNWTYDHVDTYKYLKPLNSFMAKWNHILKITGYPMRFTKDGEVINDW